MKRYKIYLEVDGNREYLYKTMGSRNSVVREIARLNSYAGFKARYEIEHIQTEAERQLSLLADIVRKL